MKKIIKINMQFVKRCIKWKRMNILEKIKKMFMVSFGEKWYDWFQRDFWKG